MVKFRSLPGALVGRVADLGSLGRFRVMCLMLFIATGRPLPERVMPHGFSVQSVSPQRTTDVGRSLTMPCVRFVGEPGGCSCGFPVVICETVFEYFDGMFEQGPERQTEADRVQDLLDLVHEALQSESRVELYPVWSGAEAAPPKGRIELRASHIKAAEFFFIEQFLYVVSA